MTDAEAWHQFKIFQQTHETRYAKKWYQLIRKQAKVVADHLLQHGADKTVLMINLLIREDDTSKLLRSLYRNVGSAWAQIESGNIEQYTKSWNQPVRMKFFGFDSVWEGLLDIFFAAKGGEKITSITDTTRRWLISLIQRGREQELGPEQIARSMTSDKAIPLARARVISRTETVAAANFGGVTAARQSKLKMNKRWVNARDSRVRELHRDGGSGVGGEVVPLDQPFSNGLMHPGDPNGSAKQVIQCRCVASMRPVRDENGMPVLN